MSPLRKELLFKGFYRRYFLRILSYSRRLLNNKAAAEDITQEVFFRAYDNLENLKRRDDFLRWVYSVARNLSYNYIRDRKYEPQISLDQRMSNDDAHELKELIPDIKAPSPDKEVETKEFMDIFTAALSRLSKTYEDAIRLCCIDGLSYKRAAVVLNTNERVVAHNLMRARKKLSYMLEI